MLHNLLMCRGQPLVLQVDLSGVFECIDSVLQAFGTKHECAGWQASTGNSLELRDLLRLLSQDLEHARQSPNGENLVLDSSSPDLDGLEILGQRRRSRSRGGRRGCLLLKLFLGAGAENGDEHIGDLLSNERQRPGEDVHEVGEPVRVRGAVELSNVHDVVLILQHSGLIVVNIEVIGGGENRHDTGEASGPGLAIHSVTGILGLVGADNGEKIILLQEGAGGRVREEVRATSNMVVQEVVAGLFLAKVFEGIGPEDVTHETLGGRLAEAINLGNVSRKSADVKANQYARFLGHREYGARGSGHRECRGTACS